MTVFTSVLSFLVLVVCRPTVTVLLWFVCVFCVYCVFCLSVVCCHMLTNKDLYKVNYPREPHIAAATWPFVCLLPFRQRHIVQHIVIPHTVVDSVWPQFRSCFWTFCDQFIVQLLYATIVWNPRNSHYSATITTVCGIVYSLKPDTCRNLLTFSLSTLWDIRALWTDCSIVSTA